MNFRLFIFLMNKFVGHRWLTFINFYPIVDNVALTEVNAFFPGVVLWLCDSVPIILSS